MGPLVDGTTLMIPGVHCVAGFLENSLGALTREADVTMGAVGVGEYLVDESKFLD